MTSDELETWRKEETVETAARRFYGDLGWRVDDSHSSFSDDGLKRLRGDDAVAGPTGAAGDTIHKLLVTCAVHRCEIETRSLALRNLWTAINESIRFADHGEIDDPLLIAMGQAGALFDEDAEYPLADRDGGGS